MEKGIIRSIGKYEINKKNGKYEISIKNNMKERTKNQYLLRDHIGFTIRQTSLHKIGFNKLSNN